MHWAVNVQYVEWGANQTQRQKHVLPEVSHQLGDTHAKQNICQGSCHRKHARQKLAEQEEPTVEKL